MQSGALGRGSVGESVAAQEREVGILVPPLLEKPAVTRIAEETSVQKERREARDEHRLGKSEPEPKHKDKDKAGDTQSVFS